MSNELLETTWSDDVANDPKHRPQFFDRPSTTVRREWCRRPQEAHVADGERYRRLSVQEIAIIQGFDPSWVATPGIKENDRIAALGNAVAPPVAKVISDVLREEGVFSKEGLIEICAGIGGLSGAFSYLRPIAKIEMWDVACKILRSEKPWEPDCIIEGKAQDFDYAHHRGEVGLLCGGPPCQPWSQAGQRKGASDPRDVMGFTPSAVADCEPDVFLFENVPGLITSKQHQHYLKDLFSRLKRPKEGLTYGLSYGVLNAADYGVPQVRRRVFILGIKGASNTRAANIIGKIHDRATHHDPSKPALGKKPWISLSQALVGVESEESWRRWNVRASEGKDFIVEEGVAETERLLTKAALAPAVATSNTTIDRITMQWPHKERPLSFSNERWQFADATGLHTKHALIWRSSIGSASGVKHLAVDGDYARALDALAPFLQGSAQVVYFDSPRGDVFATQSAPGFQYSTWLSLVRETARSAARNLRRDGFFILHVEEELAHYGRMVLDEIFGFESHVTTMAWQKKYGPQSDRLGPTDAFDYLVVYSKCHKDNIRRVGVLETPDGVIDDGDWRGCFTAGHKGARSGSEATKFKVNAPPYRWEVVKSKLPKGRYRFDPISGVLWFEEVEEAGTFFVELEVRDSEGLTARDRVDFDILETKDANAGEEPSRVWWLLKHDNDIKKGGALRIDGAQNVVGRAGSPFSLIFKASGGTPFSSKNDSPGTGRFWEFSSKTLVRAISQCAAYFGAKGTALPSCKTFHDRADTRKLKSVLNWMPWHEFGKSEDATRHLKSLAARGIGATDVDATAKPESMLGWLLTLFAPNPGDTVISIGDPNASMAAIAIKLGRRVAHLIGPLAPQRHRWNATAAPRLEAVIAGLDEENVPEGETDRVRNNVVEYFDLSETAIAYDPTGAVLNLNVASDESLSDFYAGCLGASKMPPSNEYYATLGGDRVYVLEPDDVLDAVLLAQVRNDTDPEKRIYVVYERSDLDAQAAIPEHVQLVRAPFDLVRGGF